MPLQFIWHIQIDETIYEDANTQAVAETEVYAVGTEYIEETVYTEAAEDTDCTKDTNETAAVVKEEYSALFPVYVNGYGEYMDINGNVVTHYQFDSVDFFYDGMALVQKDGLTGVIDLTGTISVPLMYTEMEKFSCGLAAVKNEDGLMGYVNKYNETVIPFEFIFARSFSENIAIVSSDYPVFCFIDTDGNVITEVKFSRMLNWGILMRDLW